MCKDQKQWRAQEFSIGADVGGIGTKSKPENYRLTR